MPTLSQQRRIAFIDRELRRGKCPSSRELARRYEISARTIQRDIEYMNVWLGSDIRYDDRRKGFYYAGKPAKVGEFAVTEKDIFTLYIAQQVLEQYRGTPMFDTLRQTLHKLCALVPGDRDLSLKTLSERIVVKSAPLAEVNNEHWSLLASAIVQEKTVEVCYQQVLPKRRPPVQISVQPLALVCYNMEWMIVARLPENGAIKNYGLWRIREVRVLKDEFDPPKDFDARKFAESSLGHDFGGPLIKIRLRFRADYADFVGEKRWFAGQRLMVLSDGSLDMSFESSGRRGIIRWILGWGSCVEVMEPKDLRDEIAGYARGMASLYK